MLSFLETPFQKSVRLLNTACEKVHDPIVRKVLQKVTKLLSDPDSLHKIKEGSIRCLRFDGGGRDERQAASFSNERENREVLGSAGESEGSWEGGIIGRILGGRENWETLGSYSVALPLEQYSTCTFLLCMSSGALVGPSIGQAPSVLQKRPFEATRDSPCTHSQSTTTNPEWTPSDQTGYNGPGHPELHRERAPDPGEVDLGAGKLEEAQDGHVRGQGDGEGSRRGRGLPLRVRDAT